MIVWVIVFWSILTAPIHHHPHHLTPADIWAAKPAAVHVRQCESGNNYKTNTGNSYYGAYQFNLGTWQSVGGHGLPSNASKHEQDSRAYLLWKERGWQPWSCRP